MATYDDGQGSCQPWERDARIRELRENVRGFWPLPIGNRFDHFVLPLTGNLNSCSGLARGREREVPEKNPPS